MFTGASPVFDTAATGPKLNSMHLQHAAEFDATAIAPAN
jgi:hypothetical protein